MKVGEFSQYNPKPNILFVCVFSCQQYEEVVQITQPDGSYYTDKPAPIMINFGDSRFQTVDQSFVITTVGQFPTWLNQMMATIATRPGSMPTGQTTSQQTSQSGPPPGTFIVGSGNTGNLWIVTQYPDIAKVWSGKHRVFLGSETEETNNLKPSSKASIISTQEAIDYINKQLSSSNQIDWNGFPGWVVRLHSASGFKAGGPQTVAQYKNQCVVDQKVMDRLAESGVKHKEIKEPPKKRALDTFQQSCHHRFLPYSGFREVYEFCENCDLKRAVKK